MKRLCSLLVTLAVLTSALPAAAETIYMKDGTQVSGTITKEDATTFTVETSNGRRKVEKKDVEAYPPPDPNVATVTGLLLAGGGHFYEGVYDRGGVFLGLSVLAGVGGYFAAQALRPTSPSTAIASAIFSYALPMLVGAYDARVTAEKMDQVPRYHIDYTTSQDQ